MKLIISPDAQDQLERFPHLDQLRVKTKLLHFTAQKDPLKFAKHLTGYDAYRFRIGNYRVIFSIEKDTIYVLVIAKRDGAYKDI